VLGFKNLSGQSETAWLSTALAEMLTSELGAGGRLRTVPGENVGRMKMELSLSDAQSLAKDTLAKVGRNLGTDMVVLGSYVTLPESRLRVDLRLQDVGAGETLAVLGENGTEAELIDLVTRVGTRLRQAMGVDEPPPAEARVIEGGAPSNREAQRLHAEGLAKLRVLDALAACELLQKAVAADSSSPMVHLALADAWTMLGYDTKAREEALRASDLSGRLPREERLAIEGRYREMAGEWDRAVEIYGALLAFFPDSVEYGLRLANAQDTGGRGDEALATLERLRRLPAPESQDARLDLAEAAVAHSRGDFRRQLLAARRAGAKGAAQGARLLVARARLREEYALDRLGEVPKAAVAAEEARRIYAEAGDQAGLASALNAIGGMAWDHGELEKARTTWEEALAIRRQIGYRYGVAASLHNLGLVFWEQGDLAGARRNLEEGYGIDRELGDRSELAQDLEMLAGLLCEQGDLVGAEKSAQQAATLARAVGDKTEAALVTMRVGSIRRAEGDLMAAEAHYREALAALRERGIRDSVAEALFQIGEILEAKDDLRGARKHYEEALGMRTALQAGFTIAESQVALARLSVEEGRAGAAEPLLRSALPMFAEQKAADAESLAYAVLAQSLLALRRTDEALRAIESAVALVGRSQSPQLRIVVAATAARVHSAHGRADALSALKAALAEATRLRLVGLQLEIRLAQAELAPPTKADGEGRDLAVLAGQARAKGFGLVARKAESMQGAQLARSGAVP
jgi:tetratricopeptide (TPR) repeat protein/TolB-like protein